MEKYYIIELLDEDDKIVMQSKGYSDLLSAYNIAKQFFVSPGYEISGFDIMIFAYDDGGACDAYTVDDAYRKLKENKII